jgi:hypothetical protein
LAAREQGSDEKTACHPPVVGLAGGVVTPRDDRDDRDDQDNWLHHAHSAPFKPTNFCRLGRYHDCFLDLDPMSVKNVSFQPPDYLQREAVQRMNSDAISSGMNGQS